MREQILRATQEAIRAVELLQEPQNLAFIEAGAQLIAQCFRQGGKLLICGNGGSLCDAMHFAEELTGQFRGKRAALPAIALADAGHMSCVGNDMGFEEVFARGVEAYGKGGDILVALSTSGNSRNVVRAVSAAKGLGLKTVAFLGKRGGELAGMCDLELLIGGFPYSDRVQEAHMAAIHIVIEMVEKELFACPSKAISGVLRQAAPIG